MMFVIITDGLENASREYSHAGIKAMVERQKQTNGWEFLFLGANIDAIAAAQKVGIGAERAVKYHADSVGTRLNYQIISEVVSCVRASQPIGRDWKEKIEQDFKSRNN